MSREAFTSNENGDLAAAIQSGPERLLKVRDIAQYLNIHEKTVYLWAKRGNLPCIRVGNRLRFSLADVSRWVAQRRNA